MLSVLDRKSPALPVGAVGSGTVRALTGADIDNVAELFQTTFRKPRVPAPPSLRDYLRALFIHHPWQKPELTSKVFVEPDGRLVGFVGVLPMRMRWRDETVVAAVAVSLMVDDPQRNPMAGARLVRAVLKGPQTLTVSESASPLSQRMWEHAGALTVPAYSMEWLRVLSPVGFASAALAHKTALAEPLPLAAIPIDRLLALARINPFSVQRGTPLRTQSVDVDDAQMSAAILELAEHYRVQPNWEAQSLAWVLSHAARKENRGAFVRRLVYGARGTLAGAYLYHSRPHRIGHVLQVFSHPDHSDVVLQDMFVHAASQGLVGLRGRAQPELMAKLLRLKCFFVGGGSTIVHSSNSALMADIRQGDALITGLAAEAWTRLVGGEFI